MRSEHAQRIVELIERLTEQEGSALTIYNKNPDFNGLPDCLVGYKRDWDDNRDREYHGDTLLATLEKIHAEEQQLAR